MLANVLRTQARFGLLKAARVAAPATRSLMTARPAVPVATWSALRAFSSSPPAPAPFDHPSQSGRPRNPPSETLFVGNVPWDATAEDLHRIFADFGTIVGEVRIRTSCLFLPARMNTN